MPKYNNEFEITQIHYIFSFHLNLKQYWGYPLFKELFTMIFKKILFKF